jgi:hypothetical protein
MKDTEAALRHRTGNPDAHLLPIILYSDGVAVGAKESIVSVMGTCGLYSDKLQRQDIAKVCLGYIASLKNLPIKAITKHLKEVAGMSQTTALASVKKFSMAINQRFWKLLTDVIKEHNELGVQLRMLGSNVIGQFYPVLAFSVGDEPAQKLFCTVKQGNTHLPCIMCTFKPTDNRAYNKRNYPFRDCEDLVRKCARAEAVCINQDLLRTNARRAELLLQRRGKQKKSKRAGNKVPNPELDYLDSQSVEPIVNVLHDMPMGVGNNIFKTPNDLFHVMCAGIIKSSALWTLVIINAISKQDKEGFGNAGSIFDQRLFSYPHTPEMEHVPTTRFRNGLMSIAEKKDKGNNPLL